MHERISVNTLCFPGLSLSEDIERWETVGNRRIGVHVAKIEATGWDASLALLKKSGFTVATVVANFMKPRMMDERDQWPAARANLIRTIEAAAELRAETLYLVTGGRGSYSWDEAAEAFGEAIAPCLDVAKNLRVPVLLESSNPFSVDTQIATSLRDTVTLAERFDLGICLDLFAGWTEEGVHRTIELAMPRCRLVQVSDYVLGDRSFPARAVPGDGAIPLAKLLGQILDLGYTGAFDLELMGPRIEKEGHVQAARRSAQWLDKFLTERRPA